MRHQISEKFYFDPKNCEVSDKSGTVLFRDETIDWIYQPYGHLPLYIVQRSSGVTLYNECGEVMSGAKNVKNVNVRHDGSYIVSNYRSFNNYYAHKGLSDDVQLFVNADIHPEKRTKYFIVQKDMYENKYIFKTANDVVFASGTGYRLAETNSENQKYIVVKNGLGNEVETLYDHRGKVMKDAQNAEQIFWSQNIYSADYFVQSPTIINGKKTMEFFYKRFEHKLPEYYGRIVRRVLVGLGILAAMGGCVIKGAKDNAEFNNTPATYLGIKDGHAIFDTDGNPETVEVKSIDPIGMRLSEKLEHHIGETYRISGWRTLMNDAFFERQK